MKKSIYEEPKMKKGKALQNQAATYTLTDVLGAQITYQEALALIAKDPEALHLFMDFPEDYQQQILQFIMGNRGLKIVYDNFFRKIFNPYEHKERLEKFLSAILGQNVSMQSILPREGNRMVDEGSLVIMDISVILEDGTYMDIEIQKIGYAFPGERTSCYVSDMIMRQYNRLKAEKKREFSYSDMKPVKVIIIMEDSPKEFLEAAPYYIHKYYSGFDSGVEVNDLTDITYISLDTFHKVVHNIDTPVHAWLTFLSSDEPKDILRLICAYPEFMELYKEIADFRRKPEELMNMYSEVLAMMDRNTVKYMCEEQKKELKELTKAAEKLREMNADLTATNADLTATNADLTATNAGLTEINADLTAKNADLAVENEILKKELERLKSSQH